MSVELSEKLEKGSLRITAAQRVAADIRSRIERGIYPAGSVIPARHALASVYGVGTLTIKQAIDTLVCDGLLRSEYGRGTFVAETRNGTGIAGSWSPAKVLSSCGVPPALFATVGILALVSLDPNARSERNNYIGALVDAIEAELAEADVSSAFVSRALLNDNAALIQRALGKKIDALIVVLTYDSSQAIDEMLDALEDVAIPVVLVTSGPVKAPYSAVYYEQVSAGYLAAQHLVRTNARRITYLAPYKAQWLDERIEGAKAALARARFPIENFQIYPEHSDIDPWKTNNVQLAAEAARHLAQWDAIRGTGIIACNDQGAAACIEVAQEFGLSPGVDYQIVGFDDISVAREMGFTSVRPPVVAMGREAAKLVLRQLNGETAPVQVSLQSHLVVRASSRPLA